MGLRSRLKGRIKSLISADEVAPPPVSPPRAATPLPPAAQPSPAAQPAPDPALSAEERIKQEKAAEHLERTRRGVLKFIQDRGGTAGLAAVHEHSEMRYFIGHQKFSKMLEGLVSEGLIDYSHADNLARITSAGEDYIA